MQSSSKIKCEKYHNRDDQEWKFELVLSSSDDLEPVLPGMPSGPIQLEATHNFPAKLEIELSLSSPLLDLLKSLLTVDRSSKREDEPNKEPDPTGEPSKVALSAPSNGRYHIVNIATNLVLDVSRSNQEKEGAQIFVYEQQKPLTNNQLVRT